MSKVVKWQMLFYGKCHQMSSFQQFLVSFAILWQPLPSVGTSLIFFTTVGNFCHFLTTFGYFCHLTATFLPSFGFSQEFVTILDLCPLVTFCNFLAPFAMFWATLSIFCHVLEAFDNFWQIWLFLATVGNFKQLWADFGIFFGNFWLFSHTFGYFYEPSVT